MSDIEKDIKRCEQLTRPENANWIGISNQLAIAGVLARIKELEEALLKVKDKNTTLFITCRNSIPKQKVKEILDKAKVMDYYTLPDVIEDLEKLLEDK